MGLQGSKIEKELGEDFPEGEHYFGCENYGNTCYCNSVLQALYYCIPFREKVIEYYENEVKDGKQDSLLSSTAEFFYSIHSSKKRTGVTGPKKFINKLKKENELFRGYMQQDAHEFLNYLLNEIAEILEKEQKQRREKEQNNGNVTPSSQAKEQENIDRRKVTQGGSTFVHKIFEGILTNETKCMNCESVTSRDETFLDLSIDIEQNTSLPSALRHFSRMEMLSGQEKFFCDTCHSKQEAQKSIKVKRLPTTLVLHLKRFKYIEQAQRFKKLGYRVPFPLELRLENTTEDAVEGDRMYSLFAIVIHIGSGPNHGHYVSMIKSHDKWLLFDDENIQLIEEKDIKVCYGATNEMLNHIRRSDCGYLLFYQSTSVPLDHSVDNQVINLSSNNVDVPDLVPPFKMSKDNDASSSFVTKMEEKDTYCM